MDKTDKGRLVRYRNARIIEAHAGKRDWEHSVVGENQSGLGFVVDYASDVDQYMIRPVFKYDRWAFAEKANVEFL